MSIRTRRARKHSKTHIVGFSIAGIFGFMAMLAIALFVSLGGLIDIWLQDLPNYKSADSYLVAEPTEILDSEGNVIADYFLQNRKSVTIDQVSPYVLKGTVDTEDSRFYTHGGVDLQGIARAVLAQLRGGGEGASTITQQLVRNTVLSKEQFEKTIKRKIREAYIATEMEKIYTKDQILMMYLNTIYYGHGAYGIEAASQTYFNKHAKDLTLSEAATLSGLPQSPSYYDPTQNPEMATKRRNVVLNRMFVMGDITEEERDAAIAEPLEIHANISDDKSDVSYPYFTNAVKAILEEDFDNKTIMQGGLKIYTTLDKNVQDAAEQAVHDTLNKIGDKTLEQAVVVMDPATGHVKALVGGRKWDQDHQFNLATQAKRQPGSAFKMFDLAAAISDGMNPNVILNCNSPVQFTPTFKVQNYGNKSYGNITLQQATAVSSNTGYIQVAEAIGRDKIAACAKNMGIKVQLPTYDSLPLGSVEIPPIQMCEGYNTLAAGGKHRDAIFITKIEDRNGNIVYEHKDKPSEAITPEVAAATTNVLKTVVTGGTARVVANMSQINQPIAGKTGTTSNVHDLWFCGYTPQYTVTVWTGYRNNRTIKIHGRDAHPSDTSCVTFIRILNQILKDKPRMEFPNPGIPDYKPNSSWKFSQTPYQPTFAVREEAPESPETESEEEQPRQQARPQQPANPQQNQGQRGDGNRDEDNQGQGR